MLCPKYETVIEKQLHINYLLLWVYFSKCMNNRLFLGFSASCLKDQILQLLDGSSYLTIIILLKVFDQVAHGYTAWFFYSTL